jgi:acetylornithine deacetylase/succinyl-diaminopimelate desuccinylase-like protein
MRSCRSLSGLLCLCLAATLAAITRAQNVSSPYHVNSQRLQSTLVKLSEYGRNPDGGVTRLGYSETDMAAREYVIGLMKDAGLSVRIDPAGNIFGHRDGSQKLSVILFGSLRSRPPLGPMRPLIVAS